MRNLLFIFAAKRPNRTASRFLLLSYFSCGGLCALQPGAAAAAVDIARLCGGAAVGAADLGLYAFPLFPWAAVAEDLGDLRFQLVDLRSLAKRTSESAGSPVWVP